MFTLIHRFRTEPGTLHPVLSERDDIIVLTDEAHRSQYDTLAMNMRTALPNAKFVAFTGTPLIAGEERTREVFGDYVSVYNFRQSVEDGATVPVFYENRTPELQITNPELNEEIYQTIEDAGLDDDQEEKLRKVLGQRFSNRSAGCFSSMCWRSIRRAGRACMRRRGEGFHENHRFHESVKVPAS